MAVHMRRVLLATLVCWLAVYWGSAQRVIDGDTLFGHEWLVEGQKYYKLSVAADGIAQVTGADLAAAGVQLSDARADQFTVYRLGKRVRVLERSAASTRLGPEDAFVFVTQRNRSEFDRWLYTGSEDPLHPDLSLFSDTITYYLTFEPGPHPRYSMGGGADFTAVQQTTLPAEETATWTQGFADPVVNSTVARSSFSSAEGFTTSFSRDVAASLPLPAVVEGTPINLAARLTATGVREYAVELSADDAVVHRGPMRGGVRLDLEPASFTASGGDQPLSLRLRQEGSEGRVALAQVTASYQRWGDLLGSNWLRSRLPPGDDRQVALWNYTGDSVPLLALDEASGQVLPLRVSGDTASVFIAAGREVELVAGQPAGIASLRPWTFEGFPQLADATGLVVASQALRRTPGPSDAIDEYLAYRSSTVGGSHRLIDLDVDDLYDWFGYGIPRHSQALRNAVAYYVEHSNRLEYLYLVGKGRRYSRIRTEAQMLSPDNNTAFVPTFGSPPSDALLSALPGTSLPRLNVARFPAESMSEVAAYLAKVRAVETDLADASADDVLWRRRTIHLSGGSTPSQQQRIRDAMSNAEDVLASTTLPSDVIPFYRQSSEPVETSQLDEIFGEINAGVGLTTFFGHGSVGVLGFNIDNPDRYDNAGRTPAFMILGCLAGDVHLPGKGVAEGFLSQRNGGMSFVSANVTESYETDIRAILPTIYEHWGRPWTDGGTVGGVLGSAMREVRRRTSAERQIAFIEQYQLIGDPMLRLYSPEGPDLTWEDGAAFVDPPVANPSVEDVTVHASLLNLGRRVDSASVRLIRTLPDGSERTVGRSVRDLVFRTDLEWVVPALHTLPGEHVFRLEVDTADVLAETATSNGERNNLYTSPDLLLSVVSDAASIVYPPAYAYTTCPLTLAAATADPLAPRRAYRFELAADAAFTTLIDSATVRRSGGVLEWTPKTLKSDVTHYWRVAPVAADTALTEYDVSSFTCRIGASGTDQIVLADTSQLVDGAGGNVKLTAKGWQFPQDVKEFEFINVQRQGSSWPRLLVNGSLTEANYGNDIRAGVYVVVIDPLTLEPQTNPAGGLYGSETPASWRDRKAFPFLMSDSTHRGEVVKFLDSIVPAGHYVGFMTIQGTNGEYDASNWVDTLGTSRSIFDVLEAEGAGSVRQLASQGPVPYVFVYRKGEGPLYEEIAANEIDTLRSPISLVGPWFTGNYVSPRLTPIDSLGSIWLESDDHRLPRDVNFRLALVKGVGEAADTLAAADGLALDLRHLDPALSYRDLRVVWSCSDLSDRRPLSISGIVIDARPLPDLVWDMANNSATDRLTVEYADTVVLWGTIFNGSDRVVRHATVQFDGQALPGLPPLFDTLLSVGRLAPGGRSEVVLKVTNFARSPVAPAVRATIVPDGGRIRDRNGGNNTIVRSPSLATDDVQPLLQVEVDGEPLRYGQLVSSAPEFLFRLIDDASRAQGAPKAMNWRIAHLDPNGTQQDLSVVGGELVLSNSVLADHEIMWTPRLIDGVHTLYVEASDLAGNPTPLRLTFEFEVVTDIGLTQVLPVPNPAVSEVRFAYELTGELEVGQFRIDIFDIAGRRIHSLTADELGPLRPGKRLTGPWDGRAGSGELLPRGTYLYRFTARHPDTGEAFSLRAATPGATAQEFGKLLFLR